MLCNVLQMYIMNLKALCQINDNLKWVGSGVIWERIKGEETPPRPDGLVEWDTDSFEHWFYSHAESKIVFDLKDQNFTYFECESILPNTCEGVASVEFIWFANDVEIYKSDVVRSFSGIAMVFEIPAGTKTFLYVIAKR